MRLHKYDQEFKDLTAITAKHIGIPEKAVKRDYYIVMILENLANSAYADKCVFKGGTSLSKCFPGSIDRFSEDIDLTYIPNDMLTDNGYNRELKKMENILATGFDLIKIPNERYHRSKSSFLTLPDWEEDEKIKLEIGSSVMPNPFEQKCMHTYVQDYLLFKGMNEAIIEYDLHDIRISALCISRTFIDKIMSVKRHAICGTLQKKVRHIYDVVKLYERDDIKKFLEDKKRLKDIIHMTKMSDNYYIKKRIVSEKYNPCGSYDFSSWKQHFTKPIKDRYETLHIDLLYTDEKQDFNKAITTFTEISNLLKEINE